MIEEVDLQNVVVAVEGEERAFHFDRFDNLTRIFDCSSWAVVVEEDREADSVLRNPLELGYSDGKRFEGRDCILHSIGGSVDLRV